MFSNISIALYMYENSGHIYQRKFKQYFAWFETFVSLNIKANY